MAFSIKSEEADRLARALTQLAGESMTEAVTTALRERPERGRARRAADKDLSARLAALSQELHAAHHLCGTLP